MYGRIAKVDIIDGDSGVPITIDGLDVKFKIRKNCYFIADASIDILNPGRATIEQYLSNISMLKDAAVERPIELTVGWKDLDNAKPIFSGMVESAFPTIPPDVWLRMQCMSKFYHDEKSFSISLGNVSNLEVEAWQIVDACVKAFNENRSDEPYSITYVDGPALHKKISGFSRQGKPRVLLAEIAKLSRNLVFIYRSDRKMDVVDRTTYTPKKTTIKEGNGIIGMPRVNWPRVFVEIMIDPSIDVYEDVQLEVPSLDGYAQQISGDYRIMSIEYNGQLRAGPFSMTLELCPLSVAKEDAESKKNEEGGK